MSVATDFTLDTNNLIISHTSGTTVYTSNQLYSQIQDWMDDATYMDFTPPMSAQTPTDYQIINGWYLDEGCIEWLNGGAITTTGYANAIYKLTLSSSGYTSAVSGDIGKTVTDSTNTGTLLAYDNTNYVWWIRKVSGTFTTGAVTITSGTGAGTVTATATGEMAFPNIYTLGSIDTTGNEQQIYITQKSLAGVYTHIKIWGASSNADPTPDGSTQHIDVLVKTQEAGTAIDSGNLTLFLRNYPSAGTVTSTHAVDLYDNFSLSALSGRNAVPLATSADINNTTDTTTVSGYSDIGIYFINGTIAHGSVTGTYTTFEAISNGSGVSGVLVSDDGSTMTLANVSGGTFASSDTLTGGSSAATCTASANQVLNDTTRLYGEAFTQDTSHNYSIIIDCATRTLAEVYEYLKYVTRQASTFQTYEVKKTGASAWSINELDGEQYILAFEDSYGSSSYSPVKASPFGTFAGGKLFAAQGVWLQNMDSNDAKSFQLTDSSGSVRNPPNFVTLSISKLSYAGSVGDSLSVFLASSGTTVEKSQYTAASGNSSGNGTFVVNETITPDTPSAGYIRVVQNSTSPVAEQRYYYSSWTGSTFTLASHTDGYGNSLSATLTQTYTATTDTAYVPYLDDLMATSGSVPTLTGPGSDGYYTASVSVIYKSVADGGPGDRSLVIRVRRYNGTTDSILPFEATGTLTSQGFSTSAIRTTDSIAT